MVRRSAHLSVHPELGAGLEVSFLPSQGYLVEAIADEPGQLKLSAGDIIIAVDSYSCQLESEDAADEVLALVYDGVELLVEGAACPPPGLAQSGAAGSWLGADTDGGDGAASDAEFEDAEEACHLAGVPQQSTEIADDVDVADLSRTHTSGTFDFDALDALEVALAEPEKEPAVPFARTSLPPGLPPPEVSATIRGAVAESEPSATLGRVSAHLGVPAAIAGGSAGGFALAEESGEPGDAALEKDGEEVEAAGLERSQSSASQQLVAEKVPTPLSQDVCIHHRCPKGDMHSDSGFSPAPERRSQSPPAADESAANLGIAPSLRADAPAPVPCKVKDLWAWLEQVRLKEYQTAASEWCAEMGAVSLEEIAENIQDFSEAVSLKPIERQRVQKWAAQLLCQAGEPAPPQASFRSETHPAGFGGATQAYPPGLGGPAPAPVTSSSSAAYLPAVSAGASGGGLESTPQASTELYAPHSVRLAMDSRGETGLDLQWDAEMGIQVQHIDPLPGQPGLSAGDFIVAIDGCSLRRLLHDECNAKFTKHLQNGATLSIVTPIASDSASGSKERMLPRGRGGGRSGPVRLGRPDGKGESKGRGGAAARLPAFRPGLKGPGLRGPDATTPADRMWSRFRRPPF